jgi:hypothetical protein
MPIIGIRGDDMFDKKINEANNYFFKRNEKKFVKWFNVEVNSARVYDTPKNYNELIDKLIHYYEKLDKNKLNYDKKKLEVLINNSGSNVTISGYFSNLLTIAAIFISSIISILIGINYSNNSVKNDSLTNISTYSLREAILLIVIAFIVYCMDMRLSSKLKRSYNLLCLSIICDVENKQQNDIEKTEKNRYLQQLINNTNYLKGVVNKFDILEDKINEIENKIDELEQQIINEDNKDDIRIDVMEKEIE